MKRAILVVLAALCLSTVTYGQAVTVTASAIKPNPSVSAPSGACPRRNAVLIDANKIYICPESGTQNWTEVSGGGGGTTINSTNGQLPYRVNSTTFGDSAFASNALNSTYLQATSGASGAGVTLAVAGGGTNESLTWAAKGNQIITLIAGSGTAAILDANGLWVGGYVSPRQTNASAYYLGSASDVSIQRLNAGVARIGNASTGAGQLLIGTSTDTVSAQLDVRSQSTTRPAARFQAASGTGVSQEMLGVYDGSGAPVATINASGGATFSAVTAINSTLTAGTTAFQVSNSTGNTTINGGFALNWGSSGLSTPDLFLYRDAANTLAQRNGANAQSFHLYNTFTSLTNHERLAIEAVSNAFYITPEAQTGTVRELVAGASGSATRLRTSLATPSAPSLSDGDWWVDCSGTSPSRVCAIKVRDNGATRTIASVTY